MHSPMQDIASVPLGVASQNGHIQVVEKLLEGGAHINYRDRVRNTGSPVAFLKEYLSLVLISKICIEQCSVINLFHICVCSLAKQHSHLLPEMVMWR